MYDKEQQLGDRVKEGVHKAGKTAEQDYDRCALHGCLAGTWHGQPVEETFCVGTTHVPANAIVNRHCSIHGAQKKDKVYWPQTSAGKDGTSICT